MNANEMYDYATDTVTFGTRQEAEAFMRGIRFLNDSVSTELTVLEDGSSCEVHVFDTKMEDRDLARNLPVAIRATEDLIGFAEEYGDEEVIFSDEAIRNLRSLNERLVAERMALDEDEEVEVAQETEWEKTFLFTFVSTDGVDMGLELDSWGSENCVAEDAELWADADELCSDPTQQYFLTFQNKCALLGNGR